MSRTSLTTTAVLALALVAPLPAVAASNSPTAPTQPTVTTAPQTAAVENGRSFQVRGEIDDVSLPNRRVRIDRDSGSDVDVKVPSSAYIRLNGDRVNLRSLEEGDRIYARGFWKNGVRVATFVSSEG